MLHSSDSSTPAQLMSYTFLEVPSYDQLTEDKIKDIILTVQGEPIELIDSAHVSAALKVLNLIQKYSPECIYKTFEGNRFLIFGYLTSSVIRDKDIVDLSIKPIMNESDNHDPSQTVVIDIEDLWKRTTGKEKERIDEYLELLKRYVNPGNEVVLLGYVPTLVALLAKIYLGNSAKCLYYQENRNTEKILIH